MPPRELPEEVTLETFAVDVDFEVGDAGYLEILGLFLIWFQGGELFVCFTLLCLLDVFGPGEG